MKTKNTILTTVLGLFFCTFLNACGVNLQESPMSIAILNESYSQPLYVTEPGWNSTHLFTMIEGALPDGLYLTSEGEIVGTPTEVGNFEFRVEVYGEGDDWDWDAEDDDSHDSEWFTVFVTERSTNTNCPAPNDEDTTELYVCLGSPTADTLAADESFTLDTNFFVDFDLSRSYAINYVDFTVYYDSTLFYVDTNTLTSQILREVATKADSTVSFDTSVAGELRVMITTASTSLHVSGRLIDIPFYALQNIEANTYTFTIAVNSITSSNAAVTLPGIFPIDGELTVSNSITE